MYILGLIPWNFAELAEAVPIELSQVNKPIHEIMILIADMLSHSLNLHMQQFSGARGLNFGLGLQLCPYYMCESSEGSSKTAHKYQNIMKWLIFSFEC